MPSFFEKFIESKGQPIEYNGSTLYTSDHIPLNKGESLQVTILSSHSRYRQGLFIGSNKEIEINTHKIKKAYAWEDEIPNKTFVLTSLKDKNIVHIANLCEGKDHLGNPTVHYGHNGFAMKIHRGQDNSATYFCNDIEPDDDFDDLVFKIEKLTENK